MPARPLLALVVGVAALAFAPAAQAPLGLPSPPKPDPEAPAPADPAGEPTTSSTDATPTDATPTDATTEGSLPGGEAPTPGAPDLEDDTRIDVDAEVERLLSDDPEAQRAALRVLRRAGRKASKRVEAALRKRLVSTGRLASLLARIDPRRARALERARSTAWWEPKLREAQGFLDAGDPLTAIHKLEAILILEPRCPAKLQVKTMLVEAKEAYVRMAVVAARIKTERALVRPTDKVEFTIEIENVSDSAIALAPPASVGATIHGSLEVEIMEVDMQGRMRKTKTVRRLELRFDKLLAPGQITSREVTLDPLGGADPGTRVFRRARLRGALRAEALIHLDQRYDRFLPLFEVDVFAVDAGQESIAAQPLRSLESALTLRRKASERKLIDRAEEGALAATLLAPPHEQVGVVRLLTAAMADEDDPASAIAIVCLSALNGEPILDREVWVQWARDEGLLPREGLPAEPSRE